jgi:phosphatidyl-myo-inositol dimannoside synthase
VRLTILSTEFPPGPGGIGTHAYHLAKLLGTLGWEVSVLAVQDHATEDEVRAFNAEQTYSMTRLTRVTRRFLGLLQRHRRVRHHLESFRPDIVVATGSRMVWLAALLARSTGIPWVAIGHGSEFGFPAFLKRFLTRWAFDRADAVICVSRFTHDLMVRARIVPRRCWIIHNGADSHIFRRLAPDDIAGFRRELGLADARLVVTVGNVTPRKGQDIVIRAIPQVLKDVPNAYYLIAGLPTHELELARLSEELGVRSRVRFLGRVDAATLVTLLNAADVLALTSRRTDTGDVEGYGIVVLEAALCGVPAVVSSESGLAEAVVDGVTGVTVAEGDEVATARALVRLLASDDRRRAMADAARSRALTQTWEDQVRRYHDCLCSLLEEHSLIGGASEDSTRGAGRSG